MKQYRLKAELAPGGNPEFAPDEELVGGIDCDGFLLITKTGDSCTSILHGLTILELAQLLVSVCDRTETGSAIRQGLAISEGLKKAHEIAVQDKKDRMTQSIVDKIFHGQ